jgi:hypothetical protein
MDRWPSKTAILWYLGLHGELPVGRIARYMALMHGIGRHAVAVALSQLVKAGEVERIGRCRYQLVEWTPARRRAYQSTARTAGGAIKK